MVGSKSYTEILHSGIDIDEPNTQVDQSKKANKLHDEIEAQCLETLKPYLASLGVRLHHIDVEKHEPAEELLNKLV